MNTGQDIASTKRFTAQKQWRRALAQFGMFTAALSLVFIVPLVDWVRLALESDTFSYVILIPAVVVYLGRLKLKAMEDRQGGTESRPANADPTFRGRGSRRTKPTIFLGIAAVGLLVIYWIAKAIGWTPTEETRLALVMAAFYLCILGGAFWFLGISLLREFQFAAAFLAFIIPFPTVMTQAIEVFYQYTSAEVSYWFLTWTGTPILRDGLTFKIPGITMRVAQECSGIRSSLVLFICSLLAGHMFLRTRWKKVFLTVFVIPLGIVRNGVRILTIGLLCVHIGPEMIHSVIHRRGGPFFFALSLVPFFLVLWWLVRSERKTVGGRRQGESVPASRHYVVPRK